MKTSYRAIKKAKKKLESGKQVRPWELVSISIGERRIKKRRLSAFRNVSMGLNYAFGAARLASIQSTRGLNPLEKSLAALNCMMETVQSIANASKAELNV